MVSPVPHPTGSRRIEPLRTSYLLFLGEAESAPYAKTAFGIRDWAREHSLGQLRLPGCGVDLGLRDMTPEAASATGAGTLVIGVASAGGTIPESWHPWLRRGVAAGLDIASGMHVPLGEVPGLAAAASSYRVRLVDVRLSRREFPVGTGRRRAGKRLLTVGTDCALGKKYTALAVAKGLRERGVEAEFRATGQTGIMIAGCGVAIDAVVADFVAGAAEWLSPDAAVDHWDVVEGQGSLFHPAYAGVTLGLLHGTQPDVVILCHDPTRTHIKSCPDFAIPTLPEAAGAYLQLARLTNPDVRLGGVSLNTSMLEAAHRQRVIEETERKMQVPCFDPMIGSLTAVIDFVLQS